MAVNLYHHDINHLFRMDKVILVVFVNEEAYLFFLETEIQCVLIQKKEIIHITFGNYKKLLLSTGTLF